MFSKVLVRVIPNISCQNELMFLLSKGKFETQSGFKPISDGRNGVLGKNTLWTKWMSLHDRADLNFSLENRSVTLG